VLLVTTHRYPADLYDPAIPVICPSRAESTGFSLDALQPGACRRIGKAIEALEPDVVHLTGPHTWNTGVMRHLQRLGIHAVHTLHDLDPHAGGAYQHLLRSWNRAVMRQADQILVHGERYRKRLTEAGLAVDRVTFSPLLHLFVSHAGLQEAERQARAVAYEPFALFFGRLEPYKGLCQLIGAWSRLGSTDASLIVAGGGDLARLWAQPLPRGVELRNRLVGDREAIDLFRRCSIVVLPYSRASQSALIAAAYFFAKAVVVSSAGALPEYVIPGETGWVADPCDEDGLAAVLRSALSDTDRLRRMGQAGREWYERQRDQEMGVLESMYERTVTASGRHPAHVKNTLPAREL
jgi:glycosyltransferase involved in cell wall biosynthesis